MLVKLLHVKFYNDRETIDVKAVVNHSQSSSVIISDKCNNLNVSNEHSSNEASITVYNLTVRKLCKQSKIDRHLHLIIRDREPSRIPVKKVIQIMRKRKLRRKRKKSTPPSSRLFYLTNYKLWYTDFIHGNLHSFCTAYFRFHVLISCIIW